MKFQGTMLVTKDMDKVKKFYYDVLGLHVTLDLGENITMTGGISFQTMESWSQFAHIELSKFHYGGMDMELYFEEEEFDVFFEKIKKMEEVRLLHDVLEMRWGQRCIRFLDPDDHLIEVSEDLGSVAKRFRDQGMSNQEIAIRMDVPMKMITKLLR